MTAHSRSRPDAQPNARTEQQLPSAHDATPPARAAAGALRAVVIDDERLARRELRGLLAAHEAIDVVGEAASIAEAIEVVHRLRPDVIFLDIQLSPGTGFDLLERLEHPVRIVFVTAFDAFALRAFEVNALDYLLKPINPVRLAQAVARLGAAASEPALAHGQAPQPAPSAVAHATHAATTSNLFAASSPPASSVAEPATAPPRPLTSDDRIFVEAHGRSRFLRVADVVAISAEGDYSQLQAADGGRWLVLRSLREWEGRLPAQQFARIHRSMIVNLECVDRLESAFSRGYLVYLRGQAAPVPMSRRRASRLKELFG